MRRQEAVRHRQRREHGDAEVDRRHLGLLHHREHQRHQQHEAHVVEQRDAHQEAGEHQRPGEVLLAEHAHEHHGDLLRGAAVGHQLAEHRADADDAEQAAEDVADAFLEHAGHLVDGQAEQDRRHRRGHQEREERLHLAPADEQHQQHDRREYVPDFHEPPLPRGASETRAGDVQPDARQHVVRRQVQRLAVVAELAVGGGLAVADAAQALAVLRQHEHAAGAAGEDRAVAGHREAIGQSRRLRRRPGP